MKKLLLNLFLFCGLSLIGFTAFGQGVTTSAINGKVTSDGGEELPGATVIAIHQPSGTQYGTVTDLNGFYRISNMRVGGPYKITITFVGYSAYERDNAFLQLGQTLSISPKLQESSTQLDEVVVTAGGIIDGNRTGAQEVVDLARINSTPTLGRSIGDFARFTPQAKIDEGGDGLSISIAGINNRLNAIYIDGAVNNDVFGLAGSGTNGGQTGVSPISLDAIEQFQIAIAPFDVRQSGFAGGSINAITRSGTNEVEGSAYYLFRNEGLAAETPGGLTSGEREQLPEFSAETYGFRVGGPIVKDKAFFFVNAEFQRDETPQPFNLENYNGDILPRDTDGNIVPGGLDQARATINNLVSFLNNNFGYDPGTFENNTAFLESDKIIAKFDFNLTDRHKLTARHSYTRAENLEARSSNPFGLNFINGSEFFISTTNSSAVELRSSYNNFSNLLTVG
ncbi:MAG: carboxypeptidase regulatory-like domain-containing protein, partial [Bacteroidota bacterium]